MRRWQPNRYTFVEALQHLLLLLPQLLLISFLLCFGILLLHQLLMIRHLLLLLLLPQVLLISLLLCFGILLLHQLLTIRHLLGSSCRRHCCRHWLWTLTLMSCVHRGRCPTIRICWQAVLHLLLHKLLLLGMSLLQHLLLLPYSMLLLCL